MKPIISYTGGKSRQAAWICSHFPAHELYLEPFFGMGSVFFYKDPSKAEIINDLESIIYNFWSVIKDKTKSSKLAQLLNITPMSDDIFEHYKTAKNDPIDKAASFLVHQRMGFGSGTQAAKNDAFLPKRGSQINGFHLLGAKIKQYSQRLRKTYVANRCALKLVQRYYQDPDVLIYLDPPYVAKGEYYNNGVDHNELLNLCTKAKCKIILSGYESNLYAQRLAGWRHETQEAQTRMHTPRTEHIWLNF